MLVEAGLPRLDVNVDLGTARAPSSRDPTYVFPTTASSSNTRAMDIAPIASNGARDFGRTARLQVFGEEVLRVGAADLRDEPARLAVVRALSIRRGWRQP